MKSLKTVIKKLNINKRKILNIAFKTFLVVLLLFVIIISSLLIFSPIDRDDLYKSQSTLVFSSEGEILRAFVSDDDMWRLWTPLEEISPDLKKFVLTYEDRYFYYHPGINPISLVRAMIQNMNSGRVISGGSTITMQIARMIDSKPRTLKNKMIEALRAIQLELTFSKDDILEIYLNMAPYGGNIEGIEAASWMYFEKSSRELSNGEAALLAALPNNPENLRPDRNQQLAVASRDKVLARMYEYNVLTKESYQQALEEGVPNSRIKWPIRAPHLARYLHLNNDNNKLVSTIKLDIQEKAENFLKRHVASLDDMGITNGAVVIIDNNTHQLVAMVGSADFFSEINEGQVNGALAARSPGSALKPFLYALAIDNGFISPVTYLEDVPVDYSGYEPENYDRTYNGLVSAREALEQSLNVPAVNLSDQMTDGHYFYDFLRDMELSTIRSENDYGLSLVLGGCEITLLELTELYSIFANRGYLIETQILSNGKKLLEKKVFNSGTTFIISEILSEITRPDLPRVWEFTDLPKIAWKTGTSYGHKDAWSIGYNKQYTIGVWIGNFNAKSTPYIIGSYAAAPLLFDLFNEISRPNEIDWYSKPYIVNKRMVCSVSGQIPG
ncbi:MAG: penicillin-binding protein 1C, partial [Halanaerobiales bacterium]